MEKEKTKQNGSEEPEMIKKIEFTDEEIIQAFESCLLGDGGEKCPFFDPTDEIEEDCVHRHARIALERFKQLVKVPDKTLSRDVKRLSDRAKVSLVKIQPGDMVKLKGCFEAELFGNKTFKVESGPLRNIMGKYMFYLKGIGYYEAGRLEKVSEEKQKCEQ